LQELRFGLRAAASLHRRHFSMPATTVPKDDDPTFPIPLLDAFPSTGTPLHSKKAGYAFFTSIGSPKHVVAPMVDQSELAWRILSRKYDSHLVYTPMINARHFTMRMKTNGPNHLNEFWFAKQEESQEEGSSLIVNESIEIGTDRPLVVQFAGHDPDTLLAAAEFVQDHCDAVDLNLGCPQDIARRGHYGSFLQSDWQLIFTLINKLHLNLRIPVTAKMRVFESTERTVAYALMLEKAGAQIITVHGRTREMKGHKTGLADWKKIKAVKEAVKVPVFANGNILYREDVDGAVKATGADGVMTAEGNLYNPAIFSAPPNQSSELYPLSPAYPFPRLSNLIQEYLAICSSLETPTKPSAIKGHLFRLAKPALEVHRDMRPLLGKCTVESASAKGRQRYEQFYAFSDQLCRLLEADERDERYTSQLSNEIKPFESREGEEPRYIPHWLAQPYYRKTLPPVDEPEAEKQARREKRKLRVEETEGLTVIDDIQTSGENGDKKLRVG
jgi:tRNA-dihydrouridine synthase 1